MSKTGKEEESAKVNVMAESCVQQDTHEMAERTARQVWVGPFLTHSDAQVGKAR